MSFTDAIRTCFRKYVTFSGRASRPEYWWFFLFIVLGSIVAGILDGILFGVTGIEAERNSNGARVAAESNGPIAALFSLATILPSLAAGWRRMHDTGRSGLFLLYPLLVMIGISTFAALMGVSVEAGVPAMAGVAGIILIVAMIVFVVSPLLVIWWLTRPSQPGSNQYGPNPQEVTP